MAGSAAAQPTVEPPNFQSGSMTGIGYNGVFPSAMAGAGVWHIFGTSRIGVFADAKLTRPTVKNHVNYCPEALQECTTEWAEANFNHFLIEDVTEWLIFNAGGMYAITQEFALMIGAGMARESTYRQYSDETETFPPRITFEGNYYAPTPDGDTWQVQATAAMLIRAHPRFAFSFGYETAPGNMNAGIYLVLH